jgi:taurine dioxygenase
LAHQWKEGDLVLWHDLALQHARPDIAQEGPTRTLRKVFAPPPRVERTSAPRHSVRAG